MALVAGFGCDVGKSGSDSEGNSGSSSGGNASSTGGANDQGGLAGASSTGGNRTGTGGGSNTGSSAASSTGGSGAGGGGNSNSNSGGVSGGGSDTGGTISTISGGSGGTSTAAGSGAGGNSQSTGGASSTGGSAGASTGCSTTPDTLFCEDFESLSPGPAMGTNFTTVTNMGTLTVDAEHARGKQALHVHTDDKGKAYIQVSSFAPPQNSFFGRMQIWVTAFPTAPDYAHFTLVEAAGSGAGVIRPIGGQYIPGKGDLWGTGSDGGPTGDWTNWKESAKAESGKWLCLEWEMNATDNRINVWIDGTAKPELSVSTQMHGGSSVDFVFPTFNSIWFGWWLYQSGPTPNQFDLWLDDIALGSKRLGC